MRKIDFHYNTAFKLSEESKYTEWIILTLNREDVELGRLMYTFCDDEALLQMNKDFLGHDYYTDILTFPGEGEGVTGEIYISVDRVEDNATQFGVSFNEELLRVMIHGVLHLIGYADSNQEERERMRSKEDAYMQLFHVKH